MQELSGVIGWSEVFLWEDNLVGRFTGSESMQFHGCIVGGYTKMNFLPRQRISRGFHVSNGIRREDRARGLPCVSWRGRQSVVAIWTRKWKRVLGV